MIANHFYNLRKYAIPSLSLSLSRRPPPFESKKFEVCCNILIIIALKGYGITTRYDKPTNLKGSFRKREKKKGEKRKADNRIHVNHGYARNENREDYKDNDPCSTRVR